MVIVLNNLFSDRNKAKNVKEVILFDKLPRKLRVQFKFILDDTLETFDYEKIHKELCRKYGELRLGRFPIGHRDDETIEYVLTKDDYDFNLIFDLMEYVIIFKVKYLIGQGYDEEYIRKYIQYYQNEINNYFKQSSVGYKMINCQIIRMDSEITFTEIIEPTINLTYNRLFENVNTDYIDAIKQYQNGDNKICLVKALNSLESTLKIICDKKRWSYNEKDACSKLIDTCFDNELLPSEIKSEFTSLNSLLKSGTPPLRNNYAGHGDGSEEKVVPDYLARYALNITGSCILLLIEASGL